jgi:hypothetical protein
MSLDRSKLQMVRELGNGGWQARCPACAESGQDRKGEHLRISPEGKFGCCVFAGDREHRKRIFVLAGDHGPKAIRVRVASAKCAGSVEFDVLGRLGRAFSNAKCKVKNEECGTKGIAMEIGTLGTCVSDPRAYANEPVNDDLFIRKLIGSQEPVPSVPEYEGDRTDGTNGTNGAPATMRLPHLLSDGTLVIPFESPERYHWWKGGQPVRRTLVELLERKELDASTF